ncbi:MAG: hypothetical protein V4580_12770 [Bacteroidota bacterium]
MKPLKKRMQASIGRKKRKMKASFAGSKNNSKNPSYSKNYNPKTTSPPDSTVKDSIIEPARGNSWGLMDTVIRIYYKDLTDSTLDKYKHIIKSFVTRVGPNKISDISLTDFYSEDGFADKSIKSDIEKYLLTIGVSRHRLFWRQNKRVKLPGPGEKPKNLLYMEIGFH